MVVQLSSYLVSAGKSKMHGTLSRKKIDFYFFYHSMLIKTPSATEIWNRPTLLDNDTIKKKEGCMNVALFYRFKLLP